MPDSRAELGEYGALQWTRTQLCRSLRGLLQQDDRLNLGRAGLSTGPSTGPSTALATALATEPSAGAPRTPIRVGTDVTFYYDPADRLSRVTPDIYVLEGLGYEEQLRSFRVYERGLRPELVIHLVDTPLSPEDGLMMHFLRLGVRDVVLYDPMWWQLGAGGVPRGRRLLTHYHRVRSDAGADVLQLQPQDHPGRIYLSRYRLWLVHRGGAELRVYADRHSARGVGGAPTEPAESDCWLLPEEREPASLSPPANNKRIVNQIY